MLCDNCGKQAVHIISHEDYEQCENCSNISVASKVHTDGMLTRNSWRVRRQQSRFEGDMVRPHIYDENERRERVNPEFLKLYPDKVKTYFNSEELERDGYKDMPKHIAKNERKAAKLKEKFKRDTVYAGSTKTAMASFLDRPESEA